MGRPESINPKLAKADNGALTIGIKRRKSAVQLKMMGVARYVL